MKHRFNIVSIMIAICVVITCIYGISTIINDDGFYQSKHRHATKWSDPYQKTILTKIVESVGLTLACGFVGMMLVGGFMSSYERRRCPKCSFEWENGFNWWNSSDNKSHCSKCSTSEDDTWGEKIS